MKLCRFNTDHLGVVTGDTVLDVTPALDVLPAHRWPLPSRGDLLLVHLDAVMSRIDELIAAAPSHDLSTVSLQSPVANPTKLIAAPVNYKLHIEEVISDHGIPFDRPKMKSIAELLCFLKAVSSLVGPGDGVVKRFPERRTDHEIELAVVIGHEASRIDYSSALD